MARDGGSARAFIRKYLCHLHRPQVRAFSQQISSESSSSAAAAVAAAAAAVAPSPCAILRYQQMSSGSSSAAAAAAAAAAGLGLRLPAAGAEKSSARAAPLKLSWTCDEVIGAITIDGSL